MSLRQAVKELKHGVGDNCEQRLGSISELME